MNKPWLHINEVPDLEHPETLSTGLLNLDNRGYLRAGQPDLVFIGARPGHGKTMLAGQIAYQVGQAHSVLFFSLEMTASQLKNRLQAIPKFDSECGDLCIIDSENMTAQKICDVSLQKSREAKLSLVVVDYVQIVPGQGRSKAEEIGAVVRQLKSLARRLSCPVLLLAQLNRNIEGRAQGNEYVTPTMSDFGDSSDIERYADCAMILWPQPKEPGVLKVHTVKFRHGERQDFLLSKAPKAPYFIDYERF